MLISRPSSPALPEREAPIVATPCPVPVATAELLSAARRALREELAPLLDAPQAQAVCELIERSIGIVERELQHGGRSVEDAAELVALLELLYGATLVAASGSDAMARADAMDARLTRDIRDGTLDGACAAGVREILYLRTRQRLATTNPEYLDMAEPVA